MTQPFDQVVRTHGATVLRVCRAVLGATPDADDAWSETFLAALRAWPGLDEDTNVEAWLVRVAQRKAVDVVRARRRHAVPADVADPAGPLARTPSAAGLPEPSAAAAGLWQEVAALPERQRQALAYHYLGGLPHTETAELTGSTPAGVRRAAADGIRTLRERRAALATPETGTARTGEHR